jgi:hypothetical protein
MVAIVKRGFCSGVVVTGHDFLRLLEGGNKGKIQMKRDLNVLIGLFLLFLVAPLLAQDQPEARSGHELVWSETLGMVLLVNGDHMSEIEPGKIWGWDGEQWILVSEDAPPVATLGGVAYDTVRDLLVL